MEAIKRILVPMDFDPTSEAALDTAVRFAKNLGAKITLLHVEPFAFSDVSQELFYEGTNASTRARNTAQDRLASLIDARRDQGVTIDSEVRQGIVWDEILGAARNLGAELIVMGTHGRTGFARGILGSVADNVVRSSTIPVMTIRVKAP